MDATVPLLTAMIEELATTGYPIDTGTSEEAFYKRFGGIDTTAPKEIAKGVSELYKIFRGERKAIGWMRDNPALLQKIQAIREDFKRKKKTSGQLPKNRLAMRFPDVTPLTDWVKDIETEKRLAELEAENEQLRKVLASQNQTLYETMKVLCSGEKELARRSERINQLQKKH